jgi:hypothetical protein
MRRGSNVSGWTWGLGMTAVARALLTWLTGGSALAALVSVLLAVSAVVLYLT